MNTFRKLIVHLVGSRTNNLGSIETMPLDVLASYMTERFIMLVRGFIYFRKPCYIGKRVIFKCKRRIKIGRYTTIHSNTYIDASSIKGIVLEDYCSIGPGSYLRTGNLSSHDGYLIMKTGSSCNSNCFLGATGGLEIGRDVMLGPNITILTERHLFECKDKSMKEQGRLGQPVKIMNDVWIGANSVILGGVTVDSGAIIGAGSVVTKPIGSNEIVAGNPARVLRKRDEVSVSS